jgi:hypothetical protein
MPRPCGEPCGAAAAAAVAMSDCRTPSSRNDAEEAAEAAIELSKGGCFLASDTFRRNKVQALTQAQVQDKNCDCGDFGRRRTSRRRMKHWANTTVPSVVARRMLGSNVASVRSWQAPFSGVSAHLAVDAVGGKFWRSCWLKMPSSGLWSQKVKIFADQEDVSLEYWQVTLLPCLSIDGRPVPSHSFGLPAVWQLRTGREFLIR